MNTIDAFQSCELNNKCWVFDGVHSSKPFSPAAQVIQGEYLAEGFCRAFRDWGLPHRVEVAFFNDYSYMHIPLMQALELPKESLEDIYRQSIIDYPKLWRETYLPSIEKHHRAFSEYTLDIKNTKLFIDEFEDFLKRCRDLWFIHGLNFLPMFLAPSALLDYCKKIAPEDIVLAFDAMLSIDNVTLRMGDALANMASWIKSEPEICELLDGKKSMQEALIAHPEFSKKIAVFLQTFGQRSDQYVEIIHPTWLESSQPVFNLLTHYLQDAQAKKREIKLLKKKKTRAIEHLERLNKYKFPIERKWVNTMIKSATLATSVQEDHHYAIEQRIIVFARRFYLAAAEKLFADKKIDQIEKVFMVSPQKLLAHLSGEEILSAESIDARYHQWFQASQLSPPPILGAPVSPADTSLNRALLDFFGVPLHHAQTRTVLKGHGCGSGSIVGYARVLHDFKDTAQLKRGEILVTTSTSPAWTPLFNIVGGLLTEQGGVLSHAAIVAREYGLPAVVGVSGALMHIKTGDKIRLDAMKGEVIIET